MVKPFEGDDLSYIMQLIYILLLETNNSALSETALLPLWNKSNIGFFPEKHDLTNKNSSEAPVVK